MSPSGRAAVLLSLLVVLAGCTAIGLGPGSPTPAATATPAWPDQLPPGVTTANVSGPLDLARAHTAALSGRSFTYRSTVTVTTAEGIGIGTVRTVRRVDSAGRFVHRMRADGVVPTVVTDLRAVDAYSNGTVVTIRFRRDEANRTQVATVEESTISAYDVIQKGRLYSMLSATEPAVEGPLTRGGTTYLHVKGTAGSTTLGITEASNVTYEALVEPSGLVHRYVVRYDANDTYYSGWEGRIERTVVYDDVGVTTVERPDWVDASDANTSER